MKITKKDIKENDITEFYLIYEKLTQEPYQYYNNEDVMSYFIDNKKTLTSKKIEWFFKCDSRRIFNYEKIQLESLIDKFEGYGYK
tara:strand:+ start:252 stop:506 length:255 start_codon:yes stop_codon:yes gene_type:complete